ncbi:MAG: hypothetical protein Q7R87_04775 [Nanoarchaeota archaeon]|nr:hypothetical protein [Nanoarchaeota archaeon]
MVLFFNKRGQIGKTITTLFVMIAVLIIMGIFVYFASLIGKPNTLILDENLGNDFFGKQIDVSIEDKVNRVSVLEGLLKYGVENVNVAGGQAGYGFGGGFSKALSEELQKEGMKYSYPVCLAYSVQDDFEKRRIFIVYDKRMEGKQVQGENPDNIEVRKALRIFNEGYVLPGLGDKTVMAGDNGNEIKIGNFIGLLDSQIGFKLTNLPKITLIVDDKNVDIYYYYGKCKGGI